MSLALAMAAVLGCEPAQSGALDGYSGRQVTEWIHGITVWGWIQGKTWVPNSGLIRDGSPRSAMTWLMNELGRPVPP
jgi:hypothetical protein